MLPKHRRLSTREFAFVVDNGLETHSPLFVVKHIPADSFKFSPTAPKKIFKTAISRNNIRRRIYAAVREIASTNNVKPHFVVLIVKKDIPDLDSLRLARVLNDLFVQAHLIE